MERTLSILELLSRNPDGLQVSIIASELDMPASAAHRLLKDLSQHGYVRQVRNQGDYALTIRMAAIGLSFLSKTGVTDIAQPVLDRLAERSKELIRLSVIDYPNLVWVGVAQGATTGLRYDPGREQGVVVHLAASAGGRAWLSTMSDEEALALVSAQGLEPNFAAGPKAPKTITQLLEILKQTRKRGYSIATDSYLDGMAAMAVPVRRAEDGQPIGCLSIAGPAVRLTQAHMDELYQPLLEAADEIGSASEASFFFNRIRPQGGGGQSAGQASRKAG
ncbi:IclR family transcriptional regulator [Mariluticola halotolerans]|uniref:IclR family transcriptional regulator n=1 Tax=Mariluticola halotolerans TaxID=2909283 RepID=UPI0026E2DC13|nr:IclR family transcriptional regulator [Mariluticola halotolerans]UJQ94108.1 IclR family transcriptional regulator [Mariluticola halotolerans]